MIIEGIPSGDLECWCLLVTKETFRKVYNHWPKEKFDVGHFAKKGSPYRYKVYPNALFNKESGEHKEVLVISVDVIKKKELK